MHADPVELIENFVARFAFSNRLDPGQALSVRDDITAFRNAFARIDTSTLDYGHVGAYVEWCRERGEAEQRLQSLEDLGDAFVRYLERLQSRAMSARAVR